MNISELDYIVKDIIDLNKDEEQIKNIIMSIYLTGKKDGKKSVLNELNSHIYDEITKLK